MLELPEELAAIAPWVDGVRQAAGDRALCARYAFAPGVLTGPTLVGFEGSEDAIFEVMEEIEERVGDASFNAPLPPPMTVEISVGPDQPTRVSWLRGAADFRSGMIGDLRLRTPEVQTPRVLALTGRRAENDLGELCRLLETRGHTRGFTAGKIAAAEKKRGVVFPEELRLFFSLVGRGELLGDPAKGRHVEAVKSLTAGTGKIGNVVEPAKRLGSANRPLPRMPDPTPRDVVQPLFATPGWVVFATDGGGNDYAMDLVPGPKGHVGQIVQFDHELIEPPDLVATSLTNFLAGRWSKAPRRRSVAASAKGRELRVGGQGMPEDLTPYLDSTTLERLVLDDRAEQPVTDWSHLRRLPALQDLKAEAKHWRQLVEAAAWPPGLVTATVIESRHFDLAEHVRIANAILEHHHAPGHRFEPLYWTDTDAPG